MSVITLLTDFGLSDSYVAEMRAVLLTGAAGVTLVDVSHEVPPGDIRAAQYLLSRSWHRFPAGSVHLVVVDPGVGTVRRALAAEGGGHRFVAPDNGLLSAGPPDLRYVAVPVPAGAAPTFHGRDVFAPAAARLVRGDRLESLGDSVTDVCRLPLPAPSAIANGVKGEILYIDRFGNLVSNLPGELIRRGAEIKIGTIEVPVRRTYGEVEYRKPLAYVGSGGTVEIAVREGSAAELLQVGVGAEVSATTL